MKKVIANKIAIISLLLIFKTASMAQTIDWVHAYTGSISHGTDIIIDNQSGLYLCGQIRPTLNVFDSLAVPAYGYEDGFFCKIDSTSGNIQWLHTFGTYSQDDVYEIAVESDNVFVYGGAGNGFYMDGIAYPLSGAFLASFDTSGTLNWIIGRAISDIAPDQLGNVFVSGNGSVFKLNSNGVVTDSILLYNPSGSESKNKILVDPQGNLIFTQAFTGTINFLGTQYSCVFGYLDYLLMKCDSDLNVLSIKHVSGSTHDFVNDMIINNDGLVTTVSTWSDTVYYDGVMNIGNGTRFMLSNLDNNLNIINNYELDMQNPIDARLRQNDLNEFYLGINYNYHNVSNTFAINGDTLIANSSCFNCEMGVLVKLNTTGQVLWYREITQDPSASYSTGAATIIISEPVGNKIFITGKIEPTTIIDTTTYYTTGVGGAYTALVIDTTYGLNLGLAPTSTKDQSIQISPNPTQGEFIISSQELIQNGQVEIYNVLGENVHTETINNTISKTISIESFQRGVYFVSVIFENQKIIQKIVLY